MASPSEARKRHSDIKRKSKDETPKIIKGGIDLSFLFIILVLLALGIVMMFSASYALALDETGDGFYYFKRQLVFAIAGVVVMIFISFFDYHHFQKKIMAFGIFAVSFVLVALVPFIGETYGGTDIRRGLKIGPLPQFQPTEIMKFAIIILFSYMIAINYKKMSKYTYGVLPFMVILLPVIFFIYLEPHYSCIFLIGLIGVVLMFVGGTKLWHLLVTGLAGLTGLLGFLYIRSMNGGGGSTFTNRIQAWVDPFNSPIDTWQTQQSLIAIGSGGIFGLGLGNSRQKYLYLPESHNDFIFPIICEELGFIGGMVVIFLFIVFIFRGFYIASKAPDKFGMLVCVGITFQIGLQAILNIAVATNAMPNTGISLPFFSYGGTALMMQLAEVGVILNISRQSISENKG